MFNLLWMDDAACLTVDPDIFFPEDESDKKACLKAKHVCNQCNVRSECLDYAIMFHIDCGIFGGLSGSERRTLCKNRKEVL